MALKVLQEKVQHTSNDLKQLDVNVRCVDNKVVRQQSTSFTQCVKSLLTENDYLENEIEANQTKISHLKSQIKRVDVELEKYSTNDDRFTVANLIENLESRLENNNQRLNLLKVDGIKLRQIMSDLLFMRRKFQVDRDDIIASLKLKKQEIIGLVGHYTLAFARGMKNCRELEMCRNKSAKQFKNHLQEMGHLIRTAETNDILRQFMLTKSNLIDLSTDAVPKREILMKNYEKLSALCEHQLKQLEEYAENINADDLKDKRQTTFSLYLLENEINENIKDSEQNFGKIKTTISMAKDKILERKNKWEYHSQLQSTLNTNESITEEKTEEMDKRETYVKQYMQKIHDIFNMLKCDVSFGFNDRAVVDQFNVGEVLQFIEMRLRSVMYSIYCWQEEKEMPIENRLVHGIEFVQPPTVPKITIIGPCPRCSQIEARANPEIEQLLDQEAKIEKLTKTIEERSIASKMHNIANCPKPGSKAILSKHIAKDI